VLSSALHGGSLRRSPSATPAATPEHQGGGSGGANNRSRAATADGAIVLGPYPSSAPVHRSDRKGVVGIDSGVFPAPPNLAAASGGSSPPKMPASLSKGRKGGSPQFHLGPRPQEPQQNQQQSTSSSMAASGDTAVRGGSFFKNMFKHGSGSSGLSEGHSDIGSGNAASGNTSLDARGPTHPSHPGGIASMRNKAKSYDSLDTTVRKGSEVAYGSKGAVRVGIQQQQQQQLQPYPSHLSSQESKKPKSWDPNLYAPRGANSGHHGSSHVDPPISALGESLEQVGLDLERTSSSSGGHGANIGPHGNAEQQQGHHTFTRDIKKAFTEFHNSKHYGRDTTSPYLGDEPSVRANNYFAVRYGSSAAHATPLRPSTPSRYGSQGSLKPVTEEVAPPGPCMLKPISGTETWLKDRRYLIGPAVIAVCPTSVLSCLPLGGGRGVGASFGTSGGLAALESMTTDEIHPYRRVTIGKALVSSIRNDGELSHSVSAVLVLRQNYLFEYAEGVGLNERPGAFAHLQNSLSYPHDTSETELFLEYYESPCAGGETTKLLIQLESQSERNKWVKCLTEAASLKIEDLYDYDESDEGLEFGRGRYSTVRPAKMKISNNTGCSEKAGPLSNGVSGAKNESDNGAESTIAKGSNDLSASTHKKCDCALKIINKNEFWSRVVRDRERADTLVRETAVQASLTAQMGHLPTFLRLRNFFETIDHVVLELEILQGIDLFQHVSSKGILEEDEAAHIMRDVLICIDAMRRIGMAHRDIKPANVLMCDGKDDDGIAVKVGDFGMATFVGHGNVLRGRCGTPGEHRVVCDSFGKYFLFSALILVLSLVRWCVI